MAHLQQRMIHSFRACLVVLELVVPIVLIFGCASTSIEPISGTTFEPETDEQPLWSRARKFDKLAQEADVLYGDKALQAYLDRVGRELLQYLGSPGVPIRIHIYKDPLLNAFAMPNGSVYLNSGLVARTENEAQLATILAHELSHYIRRHALQEYRVAKNKMTFSLDSSDFADYLAEVQSSSYSRNLEREADLDALNAIRLAGYELSEAPMIFEQLIEEAKEIDQPYYFGSHPLLVERLEDARHYLHLYKDAHSRDVGYDSDAAYDDMIADLLLQNAELSFEMGFTQKSLRNLKRHITVRPDSVEGHLLLGRVHKSRMSDHAHRDAAIAAYNEVVRIDPDNAMGHRELGLMLRNAQHWDEASKSLKRYLELNSNAVDRSIIEAYLHDQTMAPGNQP